MCLAHWDVYRLHFPRKGVLKEEFSPTQAKNLLSRWNNRCRQCRRFGFPPRARKAGCPFVPRQEVWAAVDKVVRKKKGSAGSPQNLYLANFLIVGPVVRVLVDKLIDDSAFVYHKNAGHLKSVTQFLTRVVATVAFEYHCLKTANPVH